MQPLIDWIALWLPLVQGFAAVASIGGAVLSWRFAMNAQQARSQMTRNLVASRIVNRFELTLAFLREMRDELTDSEGNADTAGYKSKQYKLKHHLEETMAMARAADPYLDGFVSSWSKTVETLMRAAVKPDSDHLESTTMFLSLANEQLKIRAATREFQPD